MRDGNPPAITSIYCPLTEFLVIPFQAYSNFASRLQLCANSSATSELQYSLSETWSITLLLAFRAEPSTNFFGERTFSSGQKKRTYTTNTVRCSSLDMSPSTSVEVTGLVVKVHILGHSFRHTRHPMFYSCGVSVEELVCQEKLRTADEISRRIIDGAAIARRNHKSKWKTCVAKEVSSKMKSINYERRTTTKTPFTRLIFNSAALSSDANNRNYCLHERKAFRSCRSHCHRSPPSIGT
jgi:hypothetical protein